MKHKASFKITLWWIVALLLVGISMLFFGSKVSRESLMENRMLSGFPRFSLKTVFSGEFMSGFESWLSDNFFGREDLVTFSGDAMGLFSRRTTEDLLTMDIGDSMEGEFENREDGDEEDEEDGDGGYIAPAQPRVAGSVTMTVGEFSDQVSVGSAVNIRDESYQPLGEYNFWMLKTDGSKELVYRYKPASIEKCMEGLNAIRATLPEDGTVHFVIVPVAQSANWWLRNTGTFKGWLSNAEEYMEALADDGVYIYNGPELLAPGLSKGEYLYYRTDHHWTPRGAYTVASAMLKRQGLPVTRYRDYTYKTNKGFLGSLYTENPTAAMRNMADEVEIPNSLAPVHSYVIRQLTKSKEIEYMANYNNYISFLQGTQTPWRRIVTGFSTGRNCLVMCDSFGNCFAPFLTPYYDEVHMVDLRKGNFTSEAAGASVGEYMREYGIDDVYVILSTASGLNYNYTQQYFLRYLGN